MIDMADGSSFYRGFQRINDGLYVRPVSFHGIKVGKDFVYRIDEPDGSEYWTWAISNGDDQAIMLGEYGHSGTHDIDYAIDELVDVGLSPDDLDDVLYDNVFEAIYSIQLNPDVMLDDWARPLD